MELPTVDSKDGMDCRCLQAGLPNLGDPNASCRRLYARIMRSMALDIRMIRGHHTVFGEAPSVLAGLLPRDLEAEALANVHRWRDVAFSRGKIWLPPQIVVLRTELRHDLMAVWEERL